MVSKLLSCIFCIQPLTFHTLYILLEPLKSKPQKNILHLFHTLKIIWEQITSQQVAQNCRRNTLSDGIELYTYWNEWHNERYGKFCRLLSFSRRTAHNQFYNIGKNLSLRNQWDIHCLLESIYWNNFSFGLYRNKDR